MALSPPPPPPAPRSDADVPAYRRALGLPGPADTHVHFLDGAPLLGPEAPDA